MPHSLQRFWQGRYNGMRHPLCSVIWLCGDSGVNSLRARHQLLLRPPLVSCLTGCFKTPAAKVWRPARGKLCPGCHVLLDYLLCIRLLTLQWPKRFFMLPTHSHGVRPCPFLSALSAGWSAGSCQLTPPWLISMLRAACSAPSGVHYVGRTPCGWLHPPGAGLPGRDLVQNQDIQDRHVLGCAAAWPDWFFFCLLGPLILVCVVSDPASVTSSGP